MSEPRISDEHLAELLDRSVFRGDPAQTIYALIADLRDARTALAERGAQLAHRNEKIAELRAIINDGTGMSP